MSHKQLINILKRQGYRPTKGVCRGFALAFLAAALVDELDVFWFRVNYIFAHPKSLALKPSLKKKKLTNKDHLKLEIHAFFNLIMIVQKPKAFKELFTTSMTQTDLPNILPIISSVVAEKRGGLICQEEAQQKSWSWSAVYLKKQTEIEDEIQLIAKILQDQNIALGFLVSNFKHALAIFYNPKQQAWLAMDIEQPNEGFAWMSSLQCAEFIKKGLFKKEIIVINMTAVGLGQHRNLIQAAIDKLQSQKKFQKIHSVLPEKIKLLQENSFSWLHMAARKNQLELIDELLKNGANVNAKDERGFTPFDLALYQRQVKPVEIFLKYGADVNRENNKGRTPLFIATAYQNEEIVNLLLTAGAKTNQLVRMKPQSWQRLLKLWGSREKVDKKLERIPVTALSLAKLMQKDSLIKILKLFQDFEIFEDQLLNHSQLIEDHDMQEFYKIADQKLNYFLQLANNNLLNVAKISRIQTLIHQISLGRVDQQDLYLLTEGLILAKTVLLQGSDSINHQRCLYFSIKIKNKSGELWKDLAAHMRKLGNNGFGLLSFGNFFAGFGKNFYELSKLKNESSKGV